MRTTLAIALLAAAPASAWEFNSAPVCMIWHQTETSKIMVSYDVSAPKPYALDVVLKSGRWPDTSPFSVTFEGANSFTISTDRHLVSEDAKTVTASDTGFGNVLKGLENNATASPKLGTQGVTFPLEGAAEVVQKFRDCTRPKLG